MASSSLTVFGLEIPASISDLEGFRRWFADLGEGAPRGSYCRGRVHIEMSPRDFTTHEPVVAAISAVLKPLAGASGLGRWFTPPSWFTDLDSRLSAEPDGFLVTFASFESDRMRLNPERPNELLGRPDLVVEVVSRTSARKDLVERVEDYAQAGIREYWIVDARGEGPELRILTLGPDGRYEAPETSSRSGAVSRLFSKRFRLVRFQDRSGLPDYRLEAGPLDG